MFAERWQRCHNDAVDEATKSVYRELTTQGGRRSSKKRQAYAEYIKVATLVYFFTARKYCSGDLSVA